MDLPKPDDVLAQATRARLFALLSDLGRPASTDELAQRLGLHANGVRIHLERLREAGLLVRRRASQPRGRPRDEWTVSPEAEPGGSPPRAYGDLSRWLARAIPAEPDRLAEVEETGREIGREIGQSTSAPAEEALQDVLAALGFQPALSRANGRVACELRNCPYRRSVKENQDVVCTLHRGLTRGLLEVLEPKAELVGFVPHHPDTAGCEIHIEGLPPGGG